MPDYKLQHISLLLVKTELKNHICSRFYGISRESPVLMQQGLKNADISILNNFLAIFFHFFLDIEKFCQVLFTCQISAQLDHSNTIYKGGGAVRICPPPAIPICKMPGLFRVNEVMVMI